MTLYVGSNDEADELQSCKQLVKDRVASRLFAKDASLWGKGAAKEASQRLGWVSFSAESQSLIERITALREELASDGIDRVVLCGMGGSSLAPEIIAQWAGVDLTVLDSTHPARVRRTVQCDLRRTVVVISSKSGSTIDTLSHQAAFEEAFAHAGLDISRHMVIVTDPGTDLGARARARGLQVFDADPEVGGRYSALTAFGLVPAGLAGADISRLIDEAKSSVEMLSTDSLDNPGNQLAGLMHAALPDRFTLAVYPSRNAEWGLGTWVEQLIAESTGKQGRGILPIALGRTAPEVTGKLLPNVLRVSVGEAPTQEPLAGHELEVAGPLGAQFLLWEVATALLGRLLEVNPFDQPDVESAKAAARELLGSTQPITDAQGTLGDVPEIEVLDSAGFSLRSSDEVISALSQLVTSDRFLSVQAYLDSDSGLESPLNVVRDRLAALLGAPVSLDWGPRFLHSTGQFHKGGPARGVFLQLLDTAKPEFSISGAAGEFGALISAQAHGDRTVLKAQGLPVIALRSAEPQRLVEALSIALLRAPMPTA